MATTASTCPYCGVGCGVLIDTAPDASGVEQITGVRGDPDHPANFGRLCSKGSTLHLTARAAIAPSVRLLHPSLRTAKTTPRERTDWNTALNAVADRIAQTVRTHGPDSVGVYISGQLLTEDYYVFNKLAKGLLGTNNIDSNSRLCMSSAVAGYKATLGADAPPACYEDIDHAELLFITGSNTAYAHPVLFRRVEDARARNPAMKMIVVDPRVTDTARMADLHLQILPGSDVALYHGMLHLLLWEELVDADYIAAHTEGFADLKRLVREFTPEVTTRLCGVTTEQLTQAALWFGQSRAVLSLYCQGLNQSASGTAKNAALINLHLATGQIGRPGAGPFSLTGQPNAMGGREVGGMANLMSGHRDLANAEHRAEVAKLWGVDDVPAQPGKTAVQMFEAAARGEIKLLWIACTNPAQSLPDQATVRAALERAQCVIVQEAFSTAATLAYADIVLPASTWGEKEGSVTNSERRISRVRAAVPAAGEARADWSIAVDVARRLEDRLRPGAPTLFPYDSPEQVWNEHRETTRGRDLDITGLSYARLDAQGPQHWPYPEGGAPLARLYADGIFPTDSGRAKFAALPFKPLAELTDARYPIGLTTGRLRDQWHGMTRTGTLGRLFAHAAEPAIELHPSELARRNLKAGDLLKVASRRGAIMMNAAANDDVRPGQAFIAMHWGSEFMRGAGVNALTSPACDPSSLQPELKHCAVRIEPAALPWKLVAFGWFDETQHAAARAALREAFDDCGHAICVPFGTESDIKDTNSIGLLFRAAHAHALPDDVLSRIESAFALSDGPVLRYDDAQRGHRRRMRVAGNTLDAVLLAGDCSAEPWLREALDTALDVSAFGRALLLPQAKAPGAIKPRGKQVCQCHGVSETAINDAIVRLSANGHVAAPDMLAQLGDALHCGTSCGSCKPELNMLIHKHATQR
jgi:assimilatory nitrate reductase catalytic subunit